MNVIPLPAKIALFVIVFGGLLVLTARARHDFARHRRARGVLQVLALLPGIGFLVLALITERLPILRGSAWSFQDMAVRLSTLASGMSFVFFVMLSLVPWVLDRLEARAFSSFVAARYIRAQKSGFLTVISILSVVGVMLSSGAIIIVISVMGGFAADLKRKILGNNAHIVVDTTAQVAWEDYDAVLKRIRAVRDVVAATPVVHGEGILSSASNNAGVIVRGIDPETIGKVIDIEANLEVGKLIYLSDPEKLRRLPTNEVIGLGPGGDPVLKEPPILPDDLDPKVREALDAAPPLRPGVIIGRELSRTLHVYVGDDVTLVSPLGDLGPMGVMPRTRKFRVAAVFFSGMYEYDASHVYMTMDIAQQYYNLPGKISAIDIKVHDAENTEATTIAVTSAVNRDDLRVRDWRNINKNLFSALKLERFATFAILSIAILVASFCIICTLLLMVTEKAKEIAILKAMGAKDSAIVRTFIAEGMIIGGIGTLFGVAFALSLCTGLSWFGVRLDPDVYYIDRLPVHVNGPDFIAVALAAFTICTIATIPPAMAASRLRPVDGLRYE